MDLDKLDKILDEVFDGTESVPLFPQHDYRLKKLLAKSEKWLEKNYKPKAQTRKLRENPPNSGNYS